MTLRLRLFALLVALAALLAVGEWALLRALSADLEEELATAAVSVGRDVLRLLGDDELASLPGLGGAHPPGKIERRIVVFRDHQTVEEMTSGGPAPEGKRGLAPSPPTGKPPPPPPGVAQGVLELSSHTPDGGVLTERHEVRMRLERGDAPRALVLHGPNVAQRVPLPTSGVEGAVDRFTRRLLLSSLGLFAGALAIAVVVTHRFTRPLRDLAKAARRVGEGDLEVRAPAAPGEVGEAVAAFNQMAGRLRELDAEARRLRANEQLSELGEVGRGLAHSLRNPLNALGLALDQLALPRGQSPLPPPTQPRFSDELSADLDAAAVAAAARRQIRRIDTALRGFLALSAGEAAAAEVDLVAVARDVALEALQSRPTGEPSPRVEVVAAAEPLPLPGVEVELRAALQALVVNALEASPAGAPVVVTVGDATAEAAGWAAVERGDRDRGALAPGLDRRAVLVTVDDEGPGVPPAVRARLFTPHVTTKPAGAGVGLYLAHRLATTRYGGALELADRAEGGTRASLLLRPRGSVDPGTIHGR